MYTVIIVYKEVPSEYSKLNICKQSLIRWKKKQEGDEDSGAQVKTQVVW